MKKVLVVDDDTSVRDSMKKVLQGAGYEVLLAADGREALDRFEAGHVDLLLLDMNLPVRSGLDILGHVRAKDLSLPIIILTAYADQYRSAAAAGAVGCSPAAPAIGRLRRKAQRHAGEQPTAFISCDGTPKLNFTNERKETT